MLDTLPVSRTGLKALAAHPDIGHLQMEEAPARTAAVARAFVDALAAN
ncbi:MAG: hypothetical protein VX296_03235 [Pseudomonadota bacterium]|nr:hypothetical protein [Pseudomonadota bacterium]